VKILAYLKYGEVFARAKFAGLDPHRVVRLLAVIADEATLVMPNARVSGARGSSWRSRPDRKMIPIPRALSIGLSAKPPAVWYR
jgi:hypothetical protein